MTSPLPSQPAEHVDRVLCVLAHPDDVDFGSAGTVATWTAAGTEVVYCIVTDGDAGGFDETPREQMGPLRQEEQRRRRGRSGSTTSGSSATPTAGWSSRSTCAATSAG